MSFSHNYELKHASSLCLKRIELFIYVGLLFRGSLWHGLMKFRFVILLLISHHQFTTVFYVVGQLKDFNAPNWQPIINLEQSSKRNTVFISLVRGARWCSLIGQLPNWKVHKLHCNLLPVSCWCTIYSRDLIKQHTRLFWKKKTES